MGNICDNSEVVLCDLLEDVSKRAIIELTNKYKTVISKDPGKCAIGKHIIDTSDQNRFTKNSTLCRFPN